MSTNINTTCAGGRFRLSPTLTLPLLVAFTLAAVCSAFLLPRISQDVAYNQFADNRSFLRIPHFFDVGSNACFLFVGALGLGFLLRAERLGTKVSFITAEERWPYLLFFLGVALTGIGSAYYHWAPDNGRLVWDRLPMSIAFTSLFAAIISERVSVRLGLLSLLPLIALGVGSVLYWHFTELKGRGDLRLYGFVQFYPLLAIPLLMILFRARYTRSTDLFAVLAFYALAKVFEVLDARLFDISHLVSGHTLKHLAAAMGTYWVLRMLKRRYPLDPVVRAPTDGSKSAFMPRISGTA
jgi:hypothetical protein